MMKALLVSIAATVALAPVFATDPITTRHLSVSTSASTNAVAPGQRVSLAVEITPKPNMHVSAPGQPDVIPLSLTLTPGEVQIAQPVQFPKPEKLDVKELGETQLVYS